LESRLEEEQRRTEKNREEQREIRTQDTTEFTEYYTEIHRERVECKHACIYIQSGHTKTTLRREEKRRDRDAHSASLSFISSFLCLYFLTITTAVEILTPHSLSLSLIRRDREHSHTLDSQTKPSVRTHVVWADAERAALGRYSAAAAAARQT
jgi:hypothetical protein